MVLGIVVVPLMLEETIELVIYRSMRLFVAAALVTSTNSPVVETLQLLNERLMFWFVVPFIAVTSLVPRDIRQLVKTRVAPLSSISKSCAGAPIVKLILEKAN